MENEEKRMISSYEVIQSIHIVLPCGFKGIAVAAPVIVVAALTVPAYIRVRGFRVMPDDKLTVRPVLTPDIRTAVLSSAMSASERF